MLARLVMVRTYHALSSPVKSALPCATLCSMATECGATMTDETAGMEPRTFRCMLRSGHRGCHYCQTGGGGIAWPNLRLWPPRYSQVGGESAP
jgi:hypothetical protein